MWDMDEVTAADTILTNSGQLPGHMNHPGAGMNMLFAAVLPALHATMGVPDLTVGQLNAAPDPLLAAAAQNRCAAAVQCGCGMGDCAAAVGCPVAVVWVG